MPEVQIEPAVAPASTPDSPRPGEEVGRGGIDAAKQAGAVAAAAAARAERREASQEPEALLGQLADAAYGRGLWSKLSPDKRLAALVKLLEYRAQKPGRAVAVEPPDEPDQSATSTMVIE